MKSWKMIVLGVLAVTIVAAGKTAIGIWYFTNDGQVGISVAIFLFALLWLLTATVAAGGFYLLQRFTRNNRRAEIRTLIDDEPGKECLIEAHAKHWCLTCAETDIAVLVVKGFSNLEIAKMRGTALQTVKTQLSSIYHKSGLGGRYQLIAYITDEVCEMTRASLKHHRPAPIARVAPDDNVTWLR